MKKDGLLCKLNSMVDHMLNMVFRGIYIVVDIALEAVSIFLWSGVSQYSYGSRVRVKI